MDSVLEYTIPFWHPVVVHLPVVLLPATALILIGWAVRDRWVWLVVGTWGAALGFAGAVLALRSGETLYEQTQGDPVVERFIELHERAAEVTTWMSGILVLLLVASVVLHRRSVSHPGVPFPWRGVVVLAALASAVAVIWTAHVGGIMVWGVPG